MQTDYLIVGVGNTLRRDDGAGWALAQQLGNALAGGGARTQVRLVQQLLPELAAEVAELAPTVLVFADCTTLLEQAPLQRLDSTAPGAISAAVDSHGLTPAQLLAVAQRLYEFCGSAWLATVQGADFAHGEGLSMATQAAITARVPTLAAQLLADSPAPAAK